MSILLTRNCKLSSSSFACISPNVDSHATITSPHSETLLRSYSISSRRNLRDGGDEQSSMLVIKEMSAAPNNEVTESAKKAVIPESDTWLKRIKRSYKFLHLNYLFSLAFMMIYMFLGALLFLWLERASDQARKLHEYKFYIHERELFLEQLDNIYNVKVSQQRKVLLKKAIDYLHRQIGVSFSNRSEWSLTTALYYSGTVLTTIGYGDVACSTPSGRLMTVIYAIVGIPIMLITLRDLGNFLYKTMINAIRLMRFTSNVCTIFGSTKHKTSIQQNNNDLVQLENGISTDIDSNDIENENENNDKNLKKAKFQIDDEFNEDLIKENDEKMIKANDMVLSRPNPPVRIPVLLAIGTTFGWIFICAGLFKIWERDWTYAESCYFMFISLSTIGLGDLSVRRRDLMIMCFVFVIIGLAMVSMCISVIQKALEDFYINVFLKLLLEYQSKLSQGNGAVEASVGMMQMWDNNKKAKYLMSFLSKNRRASVLTKVQKDAEAHGIEVPLIFSNIDEESGMPKLFANEVNEETAAAIVEETIQQHVENVELNAPPMKSSTDLSLPKTVFYEMGEQTLMVPLLDTAIVTDPLINEMVEKAVQCSDSIMIDNSIQTELVELRDSECVTVIAEYTVRDVQTDEVQLIEQEIQTHLYDVLEAIAQTEDNEFVQKPFIEMIESEVQTDPIIRERRKALPGISRMKERLQETSRRPSASQSLSGRLELSGDEETTDEDEGSYNLDWDPIDGMHAEKQKRVRDLKQFFETSKRKKSIRQKTRLSIPSSSSANLKM